MELIELFNGNLVSFNQEFASKNDALQWISKQLVTNGCANNEKQVFDGLIRRENQISTGIGGGFAIPHVQNDAITTNVVVFVKVKPLDWNALDNQPVRYIFTIALNKKSAQNEHLQLIAQLSRLLLEDKFKTGLNEITTYEQLIDLVKTYSSSNQTKQAKAESEPSYDLVAVTACPTGIAHTFIAAKSLETAAEEMKLKIKVETQGTEGIANRLSESEIANCKGVILALDRNIDLSRFKSHQNVLEVSTGAVIKNAKKQIDDLLMNKGVALGSTNSPGQRHITAVDDAELSFKRFGKRLYKAILTGVSYMLPFVIFGGILIAISFLIDINNAGKSNFGSGSVVALWFNRLGGLSFGLIVALLAAYTAYGLVGKIGILPGFICGLISNAQFLFDINLQTGKVDFTAMSTAASGFFGAIVGGIFSATMLIVFSCYALNWLPKSFNGIKNILIIPLLGTLIIAFIFWIINIPLIYVNYGFKLFLQLMSAPYLAPLLGLVLGLMMAIDLGGPINKAAYVFSVATLQGGGQSLAMAAAMAAGMVPPLGIALSVSFFKKLWSDEERNNGYVNYVMGFSFVSEGAIPFTAANPKVLIPANLISGAITGLLSGVLGITIAAPHGGIFVFALLKTNLFSNVSSSVNIGAAIGLYLIAIFAGAIASMFTIWALRKYFDKHQATSSSKFKNFLKHKKVVSV